MRPAERRTPASAEHIRARHKRRPALRRIEVARRKRAEERLPFPVVAERYTRPATDCRPTPLARRHVWKRRLPWERRMPAEALHKPAGRHMATERAHRTVTAQAGRRRLTVGVGCRQVQRDRDYIPSGMMAGAHSVFVFESLIHDWLILRKNRKTDRIGSR